MVIGLFAFSAISTIVSKRTETERRIFNAKSYMAGGFVFLIMFIPFIVGVTIDQRVSSESTAMLCAKNLTAFNLTHLSECGKFTPGSIAEDCAQRPERYNQDLSQCSELLDNS